MNDIEKALRNENQVLAAALLSLAAVHEGQTASVEVTNAIERSRSIIASLEERAVKAELSIGVANALTTLATTVCCAAQAGAAQLREQLGNLTAEMDALGPVPDQADDAVAYILAHEPELRALRMRLGGHGTGAYIHELEREVLSLHAVRS